MNFANESWYQYLDHGMQDLVEEAVKLLTFFRMPGAPQFHDYSFVVFPMAKAYEGFLKKWFRELGFITEQQFNSDHFRIGKALNPSLPPHLKSEGYVYDTIGAACRDPNLAVVLWNAWKQGRNLSFHYFPDHQNFLTLTDAKKRIRLIASAMAEAVSCPGQPTSLVGHL